jgi:hypothetical protein
LKAATKMNERRYANETRISRLISFTGLLILAMMSIGAIATGGTVAQATIDQFDKVTAALNMPAVIAGYDVADH